MMAIPTLTREPRPMWRGGGTVTYRVYVHGEWIGWVGDGREWIGHGYGGRRWWAAHRRDLDTVARWSTGLDYGTRAGALAALLEVAR